MHGELEVDTKSVGLEGWSLHLGEGRDEFIDLCRRDFDHVYVRPG